MKLSDEILKLGAFKVGTVSVSKIVFDRGFRMLCEQNSCGNYGKNHTCPPNAGDIDELIAKARSYKTAVVYQTVNSLEDSYDFEGMMAAGEKHNQLAQQIRKVCQQLDMQDVMHLGAGGCRVCESCAARTNEPCRYPELAMASLETYGVAVSQLAELADMKYINGKDTVTFFGAVFIN